MSACIARSESIVSGLSAWHAPASRHRDATTTMWTLRSARQQRPADGDEAFAGWSRVAWALCSDSVGHSTWRARLLARRLSPRASAVAPLIPSTDLRHLPGAALYRNISVRGLCPRYAYVAVYSRSGPLTVSRPSLAVSGWVELLLLLWGYNNYLRQLT